MRTRTIFLDIDGTLTDFEGRMPDSAKEALERAHRAGHRLVLCSGRDVTQIYPWMRQSPLFDGCICAAGAVVFAGKTCLENRTIPRKKLSLLLSHLEEKHAIFFLQCMGGMFGNAWSVESGTMLIGNGALSPRRREELFGRTEVLPDLVSRTDCNKLVYYRLPETLEELQRTAGSFFQVTDSSFRRAVSTGYTDGEITMAACPKSHGMAKFLQYIGASREDAIAFGDGPNDLEMLAYAGTGVAMGNGTDACKAKADFVTASIHEAGIYLGFQKLGLI